LGITRSIYKYQPVFQSFKIELYDISVVVFMLAQVCLPAVEP